MAADNRQAEDIRADIDRLIEGYEALTGDKLMVRRLKEHRPQEI